MTFHLIKKPSSPSQWDDEFEAETMQSKWTAVGSGATFLQVNGYLDPFLTSVGTTHRYSLVHRRSWLTVQPYNQGDSAVHGWEQDLTGMPTNCFIWIRCSTNIRRSAITDGDGQIGLRIYQNSSPNTNHFEIRVDTFGNINSALAARNLNSGGTTNIGLIRNYFGECFPIEYLGIQKLGVVYHAWAASSAGNWVWLNTTTFSADNFDRIRLYISNATVNAPGACIVGADYFRLMSGKGPP